MFAAANIAIFLDFIADCWNKVVNLLAKLLLFDGKEPSDI